MTSRLCGRGGCLFRGLKGWGEVGMHTEEGGVKGRKGLGLDKLH